MLSPKNASNTSIDLQKKSDDPSAGSMAPEQVLQAAMTGITLSGCSGYVKEWVLLKTQT
jgi:hypothetical protein